MSLRKTTRWDRVKKIKKIIRRKRSRKNDSLKTNMKLGELGKGRAGKPGAWRGKPAGGRPGWGEWPGGAEGPGQPRRLGALGLPGPPRESVDHDLEDQDTSNKRIVRTSIRRTRDGCSKCRIRIWKRKGRATKLVSTIKTSRRMRNKKTMTGGRD